MIMKNRFVLLLFLSVICNVSVKAGKYQNFKVSTYIRAQDVARMADDKFLNETWETVSTQVDIDKIYLEMHRDAFTVDEKTMKKVKVSSLRNLLTGEQLKPAVVTPPQGMFFRNRFMGYAENATVFDLLLPAHSYVGLGY